MDKSEKRFERDIEAFLISEAGGYQQFVGQDKEGNWVHNREYDVDKAIYLDVLIEFLEKSQPKEWERYKKFYGENAPEKLYTRIEKSIEDQGLVYVLRNGIEDMGIKLKLCFFKPESELNEISQERYKANILGCTRQFGYSKNNRNSIDMVLSLNGIPIVALELKNQLTGQDCQCAINQFKNDRNPKEFCFKLNHRFLVYFAVDLYEVYMTTQLKGENTYFMPFNQGSNGAGNEGGKGNPTSENGYSTAYLWENVLQKDALLDIIHRFISFLKEKNSDISSGKLIFPRYHQYDVVKKLVSDVKKTGAGKNYLIQHSAGSGKSNSIAWLTYRLASIHDDDNNPIFNSVIVVTNRIVLDSQLQDTINSFEHTVGLVEAIDNKKSSKDLVSALNDNKRIIICTVQKFLFAYRSIELDKMVNKNFAIIVDEAHQGQTGENAKMLKSTLINMEEEVKTYAEEAGIDPGEVDLNSDFVLNELSQGHHKNQSFFAFTATPTKEALEFFGTPIEGQYGEDNNKLTKPFHIYSMRQAIEEGFILDVLKYYVTVQEAFKIIKVSKDNPELVEGAASRALFKYYKDHGFTIAQKTEMIMSNFLHNGRFQIDGKGKAMVVADSRANAVRYYLAIKDYLKNHPKDSVGSNVLVAFSDTVKVDGIEYTEASLNKDENGNPVTTDKKFRKLFRSSAYNILVVANKYQTGFDEPLLQSMYIDKKLHGVNAVQTISRLNRIYPGKENTFVMDFENKDEEIKESFQPFYEATYLSGETDVNVVYDLRNKIREYMLYNWEDVNQFKDIMLKSKGKKQNEAILGKLASLFKNVIERYNDLDENERFLAREYIKKFNRAYSYVTQLVRIHDEDLFNEFLYTSDLIKLLPTNNVSPIDIDDKIKLEYASLKETFKGAITLDKKVIEIKPGKSSDANVTNKKKDTLQSIIDRVNERFDGEFTDADRVIIESIYQMFMNDSEIKKFKNYAKDNNPEMFVKSLFPDKFKDIVTQCFLQNNDSFQKLFNDTNFYNKVMDAMANELYKSLRK